MKPSKKKRGFRFITVDGIDYTWKGGGAVIVMLADGHSNSSQLSIDYGYFDVWLYVNDSENRPPDFDLNSVTPRFVSDAILFARRSGWNPEASRAPHEIFYRKQNFLESLEDPKLSEQNAGERYPLL